RWQARDAMKELWDEVNDRPRVKAAAIKKNMETAAEKKMETVNLIERRGRSCMVDGDRMILKALCEEELGRLTKNSKKPKVEALRKKIEEEIGIDVLGDEIKDVEYLIKALEATPVCIGTKLGTIMQEEDYPVGELGGWKRPLFGKSDKD
ncbi:hypothetical protein LCGC14_1218890, partial [marine sediment metagenome]